MGTCLSLKRGAQRDQLRAEVTVGNSCDSLSELAFTKSRHAPRVHMIKLTENREIAPHVCTYPDEDPHVWPT
ncbi:MAG: hypothetical protein JWL86_319 [Rhizobium sp.]|nr:hypothetical protein [Rhizobium sp.]